ncbi:MAG: glycosyltransferase family 4 protein [Desulfobacteraceae bacterium]|nr:glycosyltransferase family 4 protein [Desulfobacteraceae bacterium]MBC2754879.1 glycosyltransferase family 4 protein [Desulfobacteraceae bacterium]
MNYKVLCITDCSDLPETELFIGLKNAGVDTNVICNPNGKNYQRIKQSDVPVHDLVLKSRFDLAGIRSINDQLKKTRYDILYCFNNRATSNALIASRGFDLKIITYRGVIGNVGFLSPASWTTHLSPRVKRVVCVSNAVRDYFLSIKCLGMRVSPERVVTIYKGHELSWYQSKPADLSEFNIPPDAFVIGFAGRNRPRKGIDFLINAANWLPKGLPIHFILMGKLTDDKKLRRIIDQNPYRDNIHLPGFRSDVPAIASACDTFVQPSIDREGFARAVIESMVYATPPIVTDAGGLKELVVHDKSGIIVPQKDDKAIAEAILELYYNPDKKKTLGQNARQRIQNHFNSRTTVKKTKQLFEQLLKE